MHFRTTLCNTLGTALVKSFDWFELTHGEVDCFRAELHNYIHPSSKVPRPIRIKSAGDDHLFLLLCRYAHLLPLIPDRYGVKGVPSTTGVGHILHDFRTTTHLNPEPLDYLSRWFFWTGDRMFSTINYSKMMFRLDSYNGSNVFLRKYRGLKSLAAFL